MIYTITFDYHCITLACFDMHVLKYKIYFIFQLDPLHQKKVDKIPIQV